MTEHTIDVRVRLFSDQPTPWLVAIIQGGIQGILDGVVDDVRVAWLAEPAEVN